VWVSEKSGSLLLAVLMHASYSGSLMVLGPATSGSQDLAWKVVFGTGVVLTAGVLYVRRDRTGDEEKPRGRRPGPSSEASGRVGTTAAAA
jgi:hypothetical protein